IGSLQVRHLRSVPEQTHSNFFVHRFVPWRRETMRPQIDFEYGKFRFRSRLIEPAVRLTLCLAACLTLAALAQAQTETTGSFQGSVSNKSGAPIPGATIEIKNVESGVQRSRA